LFSLDVVAVADIHQLRLARWKRIQERGVWRFALVKGVVMYGVTLWLLFAILGWSRYTHHDWLRFVGMALVGAIIGGFIFGVVMYVFTMWTYRRYQRRFS
jgi:hypothetical protein